MYGRNDVDKRRTDERYYGFNSGFIKIFSNESPKGQYFLKRVRKSRILSRMFHNELVFTSSDIACGFNSLYVVT